MRLRANPVVQQQEPQYIGTAIRDEKLGLVRLGAWLMKALRAPAVLLIPSILALAIGVTGCATACGPFHTVPPQKLCVVAASPAMYTIRVVTGDAENPDTPVPPDGRVAFDVPIGSRYCTSYLFGFIKVSSQTPVEKRRVIRVMRSEKVVRKLSAEDIAKLPADSEG
jgi:hypothetical protein